MAHPLEFIPHQNRHALFYALLAVTFVLFLAFQMLDLPLRTPAAREGIISLQIAWTPERAHDIVSSWDARAQRYAAYGLGFDHLFLLAYAFTVSLGTLLAAGRHPGLFARLGNWVGWGVFVAAMFDALENAGQFREILEGQITIILTHYVGICAYLKFVLLFIGILYGMVGWLWPKPKG